jgi:tetratricopeptide (TPR) repeat protein
MSRMSPTPLVLHPIGTPRLPRATRLAPTSAARIAAALASTWLTLTAANLALAHDSTDREIVEATRRIESAPSDAREILRRGELHRLQHQWDLARADYDRAARLAPSLIEVELCRGALDLDRGDAAHAREHLDRFLSATPHHPGALELRAVCWLALGRPQDAVHDYDRLIEYTPRPTPDHYLARARAVEACGPGPGHLDEALRGLDQGIARLGELVSLESYAIDLELGRRSFDAALARLDRIAPQFGRRETVLERRGEILLAAGRKRRAKQAFAEALALIARMPAERRDAPSMVEMKDRLESGIASLVESDPETPGGSR